MNNKEFKKQIINFKKKTSDPSTNFDKTKLIKNPLGFGLKISVDLVVAIVVGVLIGLGMDKIFSSNPIFFLIFLILGIFAGFFNLYRTIINIDNNKK